MKFRPIIEVTWPKHIFQRGVLVQMITKKHFTYLHEILQAFEGDPMKHD